MLAHYDYVRTVCTLVCCLCSYRYGIRTSTSTSIGFLPAVRGDTLLFQFTARVSLLMVVVTMNTWYILRPHGSENLLLI